MIWCTKLMGSKIKQYIKGYMFAGYTFGNYMGFNNVEANKMYRLVFDESQHLVWIYEVE